MDNFIEAKNLVKTFNVNNIKIKAISDLSFNVKEGDFVVIVGPSGAGKTTLLNLLGGMDSLTSGDLIINNKNLFGMTARQLTDYRRNDVGFVFQFYNLMPNLTALENIELAVEICKDSYSPFELLKRVGLEEREKNFPSQLSGGEQQRVSIARAIAKNPRLLLCDEPTGALDYVTGKNILKLLHEMSRTENKTVIVVTHNAALKEMADQVIYIKNGGVEKIEYNQNPVPIEEIEW